MKRIGFIIFGDFVAFWVSLIITISIRFKGLNNWNIINTHIPPFIILYLSWVLIFYLFGLYDLFSIKPTIPRIKNFGLALIVSFIFGIFLFYFVPIFGISPKTNLIFQLIGFGIISFLIRRLFYSLFSKQIIKPVILVGQTTYLDELKNTIEKNPQMGLKVFSYSNNLNESLQKYSNLKNSIFIFEKNSNEIPKNDMINLYINKNEIIDVAEAYEQYFYKIPIDYISQSWIIENIKSRQNVFYNFVTKLISIIFSLIILIISSPFFIIILIAIYLYDRGPIFYNHERIGLNGKIFKLYKFRSMIVNAEKNGAAWTTENDPRITPIGKIIRKIHMDEVPQMINILKGDMTLVGPRPERPKFVSMLEKSIPYYEFRHIIQPGFTGWAQIKYRYARTTKDSKEKFEYDLYYIKNRNIFLDFGIILRTIQIIFTH